MYRPSAEYIDMLALINSLIAEQNILELMNAVSYFDGSCSLPRAEKQYLRQKVQSASSEYLHEMMRGRRFVWNLPRSARTFKMYLWTARYIQYTHDYEHKTICMEKLYRFIRHDNGVGTVMGLPWAQDIIDRIFFTFPDDKNIMEIGRSHVPWNAFLCEQRDSREGVKPTRDKNVSMCDSCKTNLSANRETQIVLDPEDDFAVQVQSDNMKMTTISVDIDRKRNPKGGLDYE